MRLNDLLCGMLLLVAAGAVAQPGETSLTVAFPAGSDRAKLAHPALPL